MGLTPNSTIASCGTTPFAHKHQPSQLKRTEQCLQVTRSFLDSGASLQSYANWLC